MASFQIKEEDQKLTEDRICEDPRITTIDDFITEIECEHMIRLAKPLLQKSVVSDHKGGYVSAGRTSSTAWIDHYHDSITEQIGKRIANYVNIPLCNAEKFQVVHYDKTQRYNHHYDSWDHDGSEKTLRCIKHGGPRLLTALVYLNDVEKGGATRFTKPPKGLSPIDVEPKKRKLLIFDNVMRDKDGNFTIFKHYNTEHAGTPVIEGEKYIFNLWFRQYDKTVLYKDVYPEYYEKYVKKEPVRKIISKTVTPPVKKNSYMMKISQSKEIYVKESLLTTDNCNDFINMCDFSNSNTVWIQNTSQSPFIKLLEDTFLIESKLLENISIVKYSNDLVHGPFHDAYDLNTERGKKYTEIIGNRMKTISISLSSGFNYKFDKVSCDYDLKCGDCLIYNNVINNKIEGFTQRCNNMSHTVVFKSDNNDEKYGYILNIYLREFDKNNITPVKKVEELENYYHTYECALKALEKEECNRNWNYKSFKYTWKGDEKYFKEIGKKWAQLVKEDKGLNKENLKQEYQFSEYEGAVVNNTIDSSLLNLFKEYIKNNITNNAYQFKDRQSDRWKSNDEPLSRFLHYELLPLIERISNKKLKPTYTYLCGYINGADLPSHTDRKECEYTVSFLIEKDTEWPIYLHKVKQNEPNKGRTGDRYINHDECVELNCEEGGIIMFQGTDHLHFREKFQGNTYNVILLHYMIV